MKNKLTLLCGVLALWAGVHHAPAQNTVFTYQGLVTDDGSAFTGAGQFQFALVTSTNNNQTATATANCPQRRLHQLQRCHGGSGYVERTAVTLRAAAARARRPRPTSRAAW